MRSPSSTALTVQPIREISDQHEGEWLLIKVLEASGPFGDAPGQLLAHSPDWGAVFRADRRARKQEPMAVLAILKGGTKFGDGDALRQSLARIAAEEDWGSVNGW